MADTPPIALLPRPLKVPNLISHRHAEEAFGRSIQEILIVPKRTLVTPLNLPGFRQDTYHVRTWWQNLGYSSCPSGFRYAHEFFNVWDKIRWYALRQCAKKPPTSLALVHALLDFYQIVEPDIKLVEVNGFVDKNSCYHLHHSATNGGPYFFFNHLVGKTGTTHGSQQTKATTAARRKTRRSR